MKATVSLVKPCDFLCDFCKIGKSENRKIIRTNKTRKKTRALYNQTNVTISPVFKHYT